MSKRRRFSSEFKREAVEWARHPDVSVAWPPVALSLPPTCSAAGDARLTNKAGPPSAAVVRPETARRGHILRQGIEVKYQAIHAGRGDYPVRLMCRCLRVSHWQEVPPKSSCTRQWPATEAHPGNPCRSSRGDGTPAHARRTRL